MWRMALANTSRHIVSVTCIDINEQLEMVGVP